MTMMMMMMIMWYAGITSVLITTLQCGDCMFSHFLYNECIINKD